MRLCHFIDGVWEPVAPDTGEDPVEAIDHLIRKADEAYDEADERSGTYGEGGQEAMEDYYAAEARLDALQKARAIFVGSMLDLPVKEEGA